MPLKRGTQSDSPTDDKDVHQPSDKPRTWVGVKNELLFFAEVTGNRVGKGRKRMRGKGRKGDEPGEVSNEGFGRRERA